MYLGNKINGLSVILFNYSFISCLCFNLGIIKCARCLCFERSKCGESIIQRFYLCQIVTIPDAAYFIYLIVTQLEELDNRIDGIKQKCVLYHN